MLDVMFVGRFEGGGALIINYFLDEWKKAQNGWKKAQNHDHVQLNSMPLTWIAGHMTMLQVGLLVCLRDVVVL